MKAVVWHGIGDIRLENVPEPKIKNDTDAIVRLTSSAICGTDLHIVRGTLPGMQEGTILGHEGVGIVEEVGSAVRNFKAGNRVVIGSTIGCGSCAYCREGWYAQCDVANPNGPLAGTAFYGGPKQSGPFDGMQAEYVRVPFAYVNLVRIPEEVNDHQAILTSDIFTTAWFGAELAHIHSGHNVAVFGCGPVGQFVIAAAMKHNAGRVIAVDKYPDRLAKAASQGAEPVNFEQQDPVEAIHAMTREIGADRAIDAVGVDAMRPHSGPGAAREQAKQQVPRFQQEVKEIAPDARPRGDQWVPGDAPSQASDWAVQSVAKGGTISIIGVYPETAQRYPIGTAMNKNISLRMGNCNHRTYIPRLLGMIKDGSYDPTYVIEEQKPIGDAIHAYEEFDRRHAGWLKVELLPSTAAV
jgi:threonine dehydrogenase-like Zn-dependent dehydrogenase